MGECLPCSPSLPSAILSQFLWFNSNLKLKIRTFLSQALQVKTSILSVRFFTKMAGPNHGIKLEYNLQSRLKYRWSQLTDALPKPWKDRIMNCIGNLMNLCN